MKLNAKSPAAGRAAGARKRHRLAAFDSFEDKSSHPENQAKVILSAEVDKAGARRFVLDLAQGDSLTPVATFPAYLEALTLAVEIARAAGIGFVDGYSIGRVA